jgi:transcriptional regulator with XRE-family HTH domain
VSALGELNEYLQGVTLDSLIQEMKANGITQKAFAESLGMSSQYLSAVKSSERRNRYYNELGAIKIACLWVLKKFGQPQPD